MKLKKFYSLFLILTALLCSGNAWGEDLTLTVMDDDYYNQSVPVDGYNLDGAQHNQFLLLASELSDMNGSDIKGLKFYMDKTGYSWYNSSNIPNVTFRLAEVSNTSLSSQVTIDESFTQVYSGSISFSFAEKEWNITFDEPYSYNGGNLLIDIQTTAGSYIKKNGSTYMRFYTSYVSGRAMKSSSAHSYCPKMTFTYEEAADPSGCNKPKNLTKSADLPDGATFTWEQNASETTYQWACVAVGADVETWNTLAENVRTKTIMGLTAGTAYDFHVRSYCGDGENEQSASVKINFTPTCPAPTAPQIANPGTTTATLSWTAAAGITTYQYVAAISGQTPDWSNAQSVTDATSAQLTNLQPGKTYKAYVRSYFSATSISSAVETSAFQTECGAEDLPFNEYFSAANPCWKLEHCHGSTGVNSDRFRFYYTSSYPQYLISPELTTLANQVQVEFEYQNYSNTYPETFKVGYSTTTKDVANFTWGDEVTANDNSKAFTYSDVLPAGVKYIAIQCTSNNAYYLYIDNFSVSEYVAPACAAPTALAVSEIGTNSAKVTWNSEATEFALQYKKTSDANWTAATGDIASGYVLGGLAANETEYTVRVKAICGETPSDWVELETPFETKCQANTIGWAEDFDGATALPACWAASAFGSGNGQWNIYNNDARFNARTNADVDLTTPEITLSEAAQLQFHHTNGSATASVYVKEGENDPIFLANIATTSSSKLQTCNLTDYTGKTVKIIFRGHGYNAYTSTYFYLEDVTVIAKPCAVPTITAANATSTGAVVTWTAGDDEGQWNLQYREIAEPENSWNLVEDVTTGYEITGPTVGHNYEVQVQANCGGSQSAWSASANFTPVCNAPTALAVTARTQNSASFSWTSAESAWVLQYSTDGENWESENVAANPFTLTGLTAGQTYQAKIQTACGSDFSNIVEFTTWCDSKLNLPTSLTSFSAVPACWEVSPAGAVEIASSKLCFVGAGEKFIYLPQTSINLNLLSATFTFSGSLEFGYIDAPNGEFHAFASQPTSGVELNLENEAAAAKYIAIRYNGANSWAQSSISAISIRKTPTCLKPTAIAGTPGVGSAEISWTGGSETAWNLQYKLASAANWTDAEGTITNPYALSGLEQGVTYKVRVQANCGEELSDWSDEASFVTDCEGIATLPWYADFSVALSNCWTIYAQDETYYKPIANTAMNELKLDGGKAGASNNVVVLPAISASLTNAVLSFEYYGSTGAGYAQLEAGYMGDKDDANTFQALETLEQAGSYTEARVALATVPANKYLAFRVAGANSQTDMRVKNLRVIDAVTLSDGDENNADKLSANLNKTVDVTLGRTIFCDGDYNTICLPFDLSEEQLAASPLAGATFKAFKYAVIEPEELQVRVIDVEGGLQAGVPYLLKMTADENLVSPLFKNVTIGATAAQAIGQDQPVEFIGSFAPVAFVGGDQSTLFVHTNNALTWSAANSNLKAFRAYFHRTSNPSSAPLRPGMAARIVEHEEMTTGVESVQPSAISSQKVLENGQLFIIKNGVKYTIQGQVIEK